MAATNNYVDVSKGKLTFGTYAAENFRNLISQQLSICICNYSYCYLSVYLLLLQVTDLRYIMINGKTNYSLFLPMMIPQVATMIPLFRMFSKAGLLNTVLAFFLPMISTPFMIMMFRQNSRAFAVSLRRRVLMA